MFHDYIYFNLKFHIRDHVNFLNYQIDKMI